jgi:hypothetical protein
VTTKAAAVQPVKEKKEAEALPKVVSGIVKAVDAEKKTVTLALPEGETTFTIAMDGHISIDCKAGELAKVPAGARVVLSQFVAARTARAFSATGDSIFAAVEAVDTEKNTITVAGGPADGKTFAVTKDTIIVIDGKSSTLSAIPKGASLHALNLCVDQKTACGINVEGPGYHAIPVKSVDAANSTITFEDGQAPANVAGKTFPVAKDADIRIDGKPGKLADVPAGSFVNLGLTVDHKTARVLNAEGPHLGDCGGSMVRSVDAVNGSITFDEKATAAVAGKTFLVAKDALILIDGKLGKLADLPAGAFANVILSVDRKLARQINAQGPRLSGVVKAVDAEKKSITVDDRTFTVAKSAVIVIGGKRGELAGLAMGASVNLSLWVDQKTVGMIQTQAK